MPEALDLPVVAVAFGRMLRAAGVPVTPGRCARFAEALALLAPLDRSRVYWAGRATFASSRESAEAYDRVFAGVFGGLLDPAESRGERAAPPPARAGDPGAVAPLPGAREAPSSAPGRPRASPGASAAGAETASAEAVLAAASAREVLSARSFDELEEEELAAVRRLMLRLRVATPERRVRRSRGARHGRRLDLRRTIRRSLRTGGDPVRQARRTRRTRRRRLVVICDVSGSMEPYARAFLELAESAVRGAGAEAFVFSTRLTRVTRALRTGSQAEALCRAAESAPDWSGGTRLAATLAEFLDRYGRRGIARGAVVAIVSDGWESGDPAAVGREMERMRRLAWRIVWVNPRAAAPDFAPLAGGMAAALPHCDVLLSGHSLDALDAVVDAIAAARIE